MNIGSFIEDMESRLRDFVQEVYFAKTAEVLGKIRSSQSLVAERERNSKQKSLAENLKQRIP